MNRYNSTFKVKPTKAKQGNYAPPRTREEVKARQVAREAKRASRGQQRPKGLGRGKALKLRVPSKVKTVDGDSRRSIKDECDQLVREIIKLRDSRCVTCWADQGLHVGHLFRRGIESTRWDLQNCNGQCDPCNSYHEDHPDDYTKAFQRRYSLDEYQMLEEASWSKHKFTYIELCEIRDGLRAELKRYEQKAKAAA